VPREQAARKLERLSSPYASAALQNEIVDAVGRLEELEVAELMALLARVAPAVP
jgi:hypothetical protein